jgi:predicted CXXCH cytochrome family protein
VRAGLLRPVVRVSAASRVLRIPDVETSGSHFLGTGNAPSPTRPSPSISQSRASLHREASTSVLGSENPSRRLSPFAFGARYRNSHWVRIGRSKRDRKLGGIRMARSGSMSRRLCGVCLFALALCAQPVITGAGEGGLVRPLHEILRRGPGMWNHPIGVRPSAAVRIPEGWPLEADGTISCKTCHTKLPSIDASGSRFLRGGESVRSPSDVFCTQCHVSGRGSDRSAMHWMAVREAHVDREPKRSGGLGALDSESRRCLGCHDGISAADSVNSSRVGGGGHYGLATGDHPVGIPYRRPGTARGNTPLRPQQLLPASIRLPDGRVSCVSCHNLYAKRRNLLTVPIEESKLCFSCHMMD